MPSGPEMKFIFASLTSCLSYGFLSFSPFESTMQSVSMYLSPVSSIRSRRFWFRVSLSSCTSYISITSSLNGRKFPTTTGSSSECLSSANMSSRALSFSLSDLISFSWLATLKFRYADTNSSDTFIVAFSFSMSFLSFASPFVYG